MYCCDHSNKQKRRTRRVKLAENTDNPGGYTATGNHCVIGLTAPDAMLDRSWGCSEQTFARIYRMIPERCLLDDA